MPQSGSVFALQVCPFLAAPSYARRIDDRTLRPENRPENTAIVKDHNTIPDQPPVFMLGQVDDYGAVVAGPGTYYLLPVGKWKYLEYWRHGKQISQEEAAPFIEERMNQTVG